MPVVFFLWHSSFADHASVENENPAGWFWFPGGVPTGKSNSVVSSRLTKKLDGYDSWFDAIRTMAVRLNPDENFFITAAGTTTDPFIKRIGKLFGFSVVDFQSFPKKISADWFADCLAESAQAKENVLAVFYYKVPETNSKPAYNSSDMTLVSIASCVRLLSVREGGNIHQATLNRLESNSRDKTETKTNLLIDNRLTTEKLKTELTDKNAEFYFAELDDKVIGYLKANFGQSQTEMKGENALEIERIYVLKEFHGKKVGQILYNKAIELAEEKSVEYIWLGVWEYNPRAIRFYEKNGFVAFDKHIFKLGNDEQTDIMMRLKLNKKASR